jgi:hypothetical protein
MTFLCNLLCDRHAGPPQSRVVYPATTMSEHDSHQETDEAQRSLEEVWYLKDITFRPEPDAQPKRFKIVTQNFNG